MSLTRRKRIQNSTQRRKGARAQKDKDPWALFLFAPLRLCVESLLWKDGAMKLAACLTAAFVMHLAACTCDASRSSVVPGLAGVFAVHDGEKIARDDLSNPAKRGNL